jgi:hypothetical protein
LPEWRTAIAIEFDEEIGIAGFLVEVGAAHARAEDFQSSDAIVAT